MDTDKNGDAVLAVPLLLDTWNDSTYLQIIF